VIYADPPYLATYSNYTAEGFTEEDHEVLATALRRAALRGAVVITTNSDMPRVRELYSWAFTTSVIERHCVGATVQRRGAVRGLLIASQRAITNLSG
jgi:DNA adenine methylase